MNAKTLKQTLEALLMASDRPLAADELLRLVAEEGAGVRRGDVHKALAALAGECEGRGVELREVASGYRYQTREEFSPSIGRLWKEKPPRYSRALLETLALIAYRQPITRAEIEEVRGVAVNTYMIRLLEEREWIKVAGYKEVPGRPALYSTTKEFLDYFNLRSLDELPALIEIEEVARMHPELRIEPPGSSGETKPDESGGADAKADAARNAPTRPSTDSGINESAGESTGEGEA